MRQHDCAEGGESWHPERSVLQSTILAAGSRPGSLARPTRPWHTRGLLTLIALGLGAAVA
jgi:hypothetical protein